MNDPRTKADEIPVWCAHDALRDPRELELYPENPNKHSERQLSVFGKVLRANGWRRAITVSRFSGRVVSGNGAVETARKEGLGEVPVQYQDFASEKDEQAHLLADNQLSAYAEIDQAILGAFLEDLDEAGFDLDATGFDDVALKSLQKALEEDSGGGEPFKPYGDDIETQYCCPQCGYEWSGKPKQ